MTQLQEHKSSTMVVDAGNFSLNRDKIKEVEVDNQHKIVELVLDAFSTAPTPLTALGIAERDLIMGGEWLMTALEERRLPYVLSNLECDGLNFVDSRVHTQDGVSIEYLSFVSSTLLEKKPMGDFLTVSSMLPECSVTEPVKWLMEHPKQTDIRIAFADLNRNEITSIAPYIDIVIESKIGKTTAGPEVLDSDTILVGVGSKGQNLGELSWSYDSAKSGFTSADSRVAKERDLARRRERLKNLEEQREKVGEQDPEFKKLQRQYEYTQRSISLLEAEIANLPKANGSVMEVTLNLVSLNKDIDNHPGMDKIIEETKIGLEDTK